MPLKYTEKIISLYCVCSAWDLLNRIWLGRDLQLFEAVSFSTAKFQITFLFLAAIKELVLLEQIISHRTVFYGSERVPNPLESGGCVQLLVQITGTVT